MYFTRAVKTEEFGGADVLRVLEEDIAPPGENEVMVRQTRSVSTISIFIIEAGSIRLLFRSG